MILNGNQRGGARDLARHLMKPENEHIEVHQIRGFVADTIMGALREAEAVSRGTKCRQFLYSLSLSPPETADVPVDAFEDAIERIEEKLGLDGHPRVVVFHEKQGRRHAHCVWSRIDADSMTAVRMSHDRTKLGDISRQLYFEHGWKMPAGLIDPELCSPLSFDRQAWFQAKRTGQDPRDIKAALQQCWAASDSGKALRSALEARGYYLARGDRRSVVALDVYGGIYALSRWTGIRSKEVVARVGDPEALPSLRQVQDRLRGLVRDKLESFIISVAEDFARAVQPLEASRLAMAEQHRTERVGQLAAQEERRRAETQERSSRFRRGILGLWDRITGQYARLRKQAGQEAKDCAERDAAEKEAMIWQQLQERRLLQDEIKRGRRAHVRELASIHRDMLRRERELSSNLDGMKRDGPRRIRLGPVLS